MGEPDTQLRMRKLSLWVATALVVACSPAPENPPAGSAGSGGQVTSVAGSSGAGGAGGTAGVATGGTAGTGGVAAVAGSAGTFATGGGGASGGGGAGGTGSLTMGTQADPGTEGDGTFDQPPPYNLPAESMGPINGAPKGTVTGPFMHTQTGTYEGWGQWKFTWYLYVPSQYQPGKAAALMVFNDGYHYVGINELSDSRFNAPQVFDNLIHEGTMPVTIAVFIFPGKPNGEKVGGGDPDRSTQYDTPNAEYGKFLKDEFIPANILNEYDIVTDADGWAIGGHSSGGIASIIAGWYHPDRFRKMLTASPSFPNKGNVFPDKFTTEPVKPLRIYHLAGTQDLGGFKSENDQAAEIFAELGYHYRYRPGQDVHYPPKAAMADFPAALRWLWRGYTTPQ